MKKIDDFLNTLNRKEMLYLKNKINISIIKSENEAPIIIDTFGSTFYKFVNDINTSEEDYYVHSTMPYTGQDKIDLSDCILIDKGLMPLKINDFHKMILSHCKKRGVKFYRIMGEGSFDI